MPVQTEKKVADYILSFEDGTNEDGMQDFINEASMDHAIIENDSIGKFEAWGSIWYDKQPDRAVFEGFTIAVEIEGEIDEDNPPTVSLSGESSLVVTMPSEAELEYPFEWKCRFDKIVEFEGKKYMLYDVT